jgi:hypothetical protein
MGRLAITISTLVALVVAGYLIISGGSGQNAHARTTPSVLPPPQQAGGTTTQPSTTVPASPPAPTSPAPVGQPSRSQTSTVVTATRTDCRWRQYRDGALSADPSCAPGKLAPAVAANIEHTVCNAAWVSATSRLQPPPSAQALDKLVIEYQLPGNPVTYTPARVIPVEDGGSPTSPLNLYPLPLNGFGGQRTRTAVAEQLHDEICSHRITIAQATKTLEGDWLSKGLPDDD